MHRRQHDRVHVLVEDLVYTIQPTKRLDSDFFLGGGVGSKGIINLREIREI